MLEFLLPKRWHAQPHSLTESSLVRRCLADASSLTQRLVALSAGQFQVKVFATYHMLTGLSEAIPANINGHRERYYVREVGLYCAGTLCVLGRTIIPQTSMKQFAFLTRIGAQPIGNWLFKPTGAPRRKIWYGQSSQHLPVSLPQTTIDAAPLWVRCSQFKQTLAEVYVTEWFLPSYWELEQNDAV